MRLKCAIGFAIINSLLFIFTAEAKTEKEINSIINSLSLEQKARLVVGSPAVNDKYSHIVEGSAGWTFPIEQYGVPSMNLADGPVGIRINPVATGNTESLYDENGIPIASQSSEPINSRYNTYCTCFPSTTALAATWNPQAALRQGQVMGNEGKAYGVDVILTPGINIMRNPLCGRNFEYYSEDPILTAGQSAQIISGIQENGIGTSLKHFVANNQQTGKKENDARITQRALREIYLKAFEKCVKQAKPWTVMASYNKIAGIYTQANHELLTRLLRDEWGYDGMVMTDWNITFRRPTIDLINARCALIMPGEEEIVQEVIDAVKAGKITETQLNNCVHDVLKLAYNSVSANGWERVEPDLKSHANISRDVATESMVLLKNENNVLPLGKDKKIALFGASAYHTIGGGTGSSNVNKAYIVDIADGLESAGYVLSDKLKKAYNTYVESQNILLDKPFAYPEWQKISYHRVVTPEVNLKKAKLTINKEAEECEAAVIVIGRGSGEESDRRVEDDFNLSETETTMIKQVSEAFRKLGKPVVVLLNICGAIETNSWKDYADAILITWLPGQEAGNAVADVVSGAVSPSGRLPFTLPVSYYDIPSSKHYPYIGQTEGENFEYTFYDDDIWVGYRFFNTTGIPVSYPFGYGLSYSQFKYDNITVKTGNKETTITVDITNSGTFPSQEVAQLYVSAPANDIISRPEAELKAYCKTGILKPGETEKVTLKIDNMDLAWFNEANSEWQLDAGKYNAYFGNSVDMKNIEAPFTIKKAATKKVLNLLAPVVKVETIDINNYIKK